MYNSFATGYMVQSGVPWYSIENAGRLAEIGFPILVGIVGVILIVVIVRRTVFKLKPGQPQQSVPARVVSKQTTLEQDRKADGQVLKSTVHYYVTFALEDGSQSEYEMSQRLYESYNKGDSGQLTVKGLRFMNFAKE